MSQQARQTMAAVLGIAVGIYAASLQTLGEGAQMLIGAILVLLVGMFAAFVWRSRPPS
jgi:hypothetical protein